MTIDTDSPTPVLPSNEPDGPKRTVDALVEAYATAVRSQARPDGDEGAQRSPQNTGVSR